MSPREIEVGASSVDAALPADRLTGEELAELHKLVQIHEQQINLAQITQDKIHLLLMSAKDRRGIVGTIRVSVEDGSIQKNARDITPEK